MMHGASLKDGTFKCMFLINNQTLSPQRNLEKWILMLVSSPIGHESSGLHIPVNLFLDAVNILVVSITANTRGFAEIGRGIFVYKLSQKVIY